MMDFMAECYYVYTEKKEIWVTGCYIMQIFVSIRSFTNQVQSGK